MEKEINKKLNLLILNMAAKQQLLDELQSQIFKINIYQEYLNQLIKINLEILNLTNKEEKYKQLINNYINNEIENPDIILNKLKSN